MAYRDPESFQAHAQGLDLTFHPQGSARLRALLDLIDDARVSLKVCFYIFATDYTGQKVRDALQKAAERGVAVTLLVDGFGAEADEAFFAGFIKAGGDFRVFSPRWSRRYLIRNHQKILLVDGRKAMLGGFNIENSYFAPPRDNGWNDLGVTIEGPVVDPIGEWFARLEEWTGNPKAQWRVIRRMVRQWDGGSGPVRVLVGGPTRGLSSWAHAVGRDLQRANRIDMVMAYFSPSPRLRKRLRRIARKGEARLILAGKSDNTATIAASRALYRKLLDAGAAIYEFQPCKLHTKLIVLDDVVYLGSANFDMRSLYINLEIVLRIEDAGLAEQLREFIDHYCPASERVTKQAHEKRATFFNRIRWWASWFLVSVVDYTVSRRLNLGQ
ncbi:phospholipase D-like domain-containing protein [Altericroceibacterium endophyticum]|uniref:phospholipase D-like domain-containing protein n=1 Tax=Altericroceibacterium endophyticum TaxID=1808508 RepID=UPI001F3510D9|nr:cardiolipin synthase B [Altericroceibacterium endophyticum]